MIEYIRGELAALTPAQAVIEAAGVGYALGISPPQPASASVAWAAGLTTGCILATLTKVFHLYKSRLL